MSSPDDEIVAGGTSQVSRSGNQPSTFGSDVLSGFLIGGALMVGIPFAFYVGHSFLSAIPKAGSQAVSFASTASKSFELKQPKVTIRTSASGQTTIRVTEKTKYGTVSKTFKLSN